MAASFANLSPGERSGMESAGGADIAALLDVAMEIGVDTAMQQVWVCGGCVGVGGCVWGVPAPARGCAACPNPAARPPPAESRGRPLPKLEKLCHTRW